MGTNLQGEWLSRPPELKGEIAWSYTRPVHVRVKSATKFDLVTPGRDFHLCLPKGDRRLACTREDHQKKMERGDAFVQTRPRVGGIDDTRFLRAGRRGLGPAHRRHAKRQRPVVCVANISDFERIRRLVKGIRLETEETP